MVHERRHDPPRATQVERRADEHVHGSLGDERVDQLLRGGEVDLTRPDGSAQPAVVAGVVDVDVEPVLVRRVADAAEPRPEVTAAAAREAAAKIRKDVSDAEADLAKYEVVLSAIDRAMFDPQGAANEYKGLTMSELSQRRGKIVSAQEAAEARWVAASEALEAATAG